MKLNCDICIVGAGSGGVAAAYSAALHAPEKKIILIDKNSVLGGTSTVGGVNAWEPGVVGNSSLHRILFNKLWKTGEAVISDYTSMTPMPYRAAFVSELRDATYENTCSAISGRGRVVFDPRGMVHALEDVLYQFSNLQIILDCVLTGVSVNEQHITEIQANHTQYNENLEIHSDLFIDSTAEITLSQLAGCETILSNTPNGLSQMFVVRRKEYRGIDPIPAWVHKTDAMEWAAKNGPCTIFNQYPNGMMNGNTLPTMDAEEYYAYGLNARRIAIARTYALWNILQKNCGMDYYEICHLFPMLGIREGHLLTGRYVLTAEEMIKGAQEQELHDHIIAFGDHSIDFHYSDDPNDSQSVDMKQPYGVPYECLLPKELDNLIVACRGISLTHTAAASCRLQRTILQIGEAAGIAAAYCHSDFTEITPQAIHTKMVESCKEPVS